MSTNIAPPIYQAPKSPRFQSLPTLSSIVDKQSLDVMVTQSKNTILQVLKNVRWIRLGITGFLLAWLGFFTYQILKPNIDEKRNENEARWFQLHRIWFGDESIVFILFRVWYLVLVFMAISPIIGEVIELLRNVRV
jgi:hypothetical protein